MSRIFDSLTTGSQLRSMWCGAGTDSDAAAEEVEAAAVVSSVIRPKRRDSRWIQFGEDEPTDDPSDVLEAPDTPVVERRVAGDYNDDNATEHAPLRASTFSGAAAVQESTRSGVYRRQTVEPELEPEPEPEPEPREVNSDHELEAWLPPKQPARQQQQRPPPSPDAQRSGGWTTSGKHDAQVDLSEEDMWAARARALGRSASSQFNVLQRLSVQPRTLPPRPTFLDKAVVDEDTNSVHGLLAQMEWKRNAASRRFRSPTVLRSETQRFGLEKRRNMRRKTPEATIGAPNAEKAPDLAALDKWLSALHLDYLAMPLYEVRKVTAYRADISVNLQPITQASKTLSVPADAWCCHG